MDTKVIQDKIYGGLMMKHYFEKECKVVFAAGVAIGAGVFAFLKTKKAREIAVKGVAGSMIIKDKVMEGVINIKEDAEDIYAEAKVVAQQDYECSCACDEDKE